MMVPVRDLERTGVGTRPALQARHDSPGRGGGGGTWEGLQMVPGWSGCHKLRPTNFQVASHVGSI